jgi:hypothetical protein
VDDALLVRMLHGVADGNKQLQALLGGQLLGVTVFRDRPPLDQLHDEVGPA